MPMSNSFYLHLLNSFLAPATEIATKYSCKTRSCEQVPAMCSHGTLTEREGNGYETDAEHLQNGHRTDTERIRNGYRMRSVQRSLSGYF